MTVDAGAWCPNCESHRIDQGRPECPVCSDRATKDATAAATILGWRVYGGRA